MGIVTHELAGASQADLDAMAAYVAKLMGSEPSTARKGDRSAPPRTDAASREPGAVIFPTACRSCHDGDRELPWGALALHLSTPISGESPRNLINVIIHGLPPAEGETTPMMPGYAGALDDTQVAEVVGWMRANLSDRPPWNDIPALIAQSKRMTGDMI